MRQITRDLYTTGRVWLSLSHNFTQESEGKRSIELTKSRKGYVTLNAGALFILTFWSTTGGVPEKFFIPEYKITELKSILETMYSLRTDERYVRDDTLTAAGKASSLYYRLQLSSKSNYIDVYFTEFEYNGEKAINIAIEHKGKVYTMYDSNVLEIIDNIPTPAEVTRYKQDAAQLFLISQMLGKHTPGSDGDGVVPSAPVKKAPPKTIKQVQRRTFDTGPVPVEAIKQVEEETITEPDYDDYDDVEPIGDYDYNEPSEELEETDEFDYSNLLGDE